MQVYCFNIWHGKTWLEKVIIIEHFTVLFVIDNQKVWRYYIKSVGVSLIGLFILEPWKQHSYIMYMVCWKTGEILLKIISWYKHFKKLKIYTVILDCVYHVNWLVSHFSTVLLKVQQTVLSTLPRIVCADWLKLYGDLIQDYIKSLSRNGSNITLIIWIELFQFSFRLPI